MVSLFFYEFILATAKDLLLVLANNALELSAVVISYSAYRDSVESRRLSQESEKRAQELAARTSERDQYDRKLERFNARVREWIEDLLTEREDRIEHLHYALRIYKVYGYWKHLKISKEDALAEIELNTPTSITTSRKNSPLSCFEDAFEFIRILEEWISNESFPRELHIAREQVRDLMFRENTKELLNHGAITKKEYERRLKEDLPSVVGEDYVPPSVSFKPLKT